MLRKTLVIGSVCAAMASLSYAGNSCNSGSCPQPVNAFNGFYLGVGMGYQALSAKVTAPNYTVDGSKTQSHGGILASFLFGYDHTLGQNWLLGVQGAVSEFQLNTTNQWGLNGGSTQQTSITQEHPFYTLALRGGYLINPHNLIYLLVGGEVAQFQGKYTNNTTTISSKTSSLTGWMLGLGADQHVCGGFHVFEQVAYTNFGGELKLNTQNIKFSPSTYSALIGMAYKFN